MAYIQFDISSQSLYATLYMLELLLALLYVLSIYSFVILVLYSMHLESPPETVNTVAKDKEVNDEQSKSNSQSISRAYQKHS